MQEQINTAKKLYSMLREAEASLETSAHKMQALVDQSAAAALEASDGSAAFDVLLAAQRAHQRSLASLSLFHRQLQALADARGLTTAIGFEEKPRETPRGHLAA